VWLKSLFWDMKPHPWTIARYVLDVLDRNFRPLNTTRLPYLETSAMDYPFTRRHIPQERKYCSLVFSWNWNCLGLSTCRRKFSGDFQEFTNSTKLSASRLRVSESPQIFQVTYPVSECLPPSLLLFNYDLRTIYSICRR